MSTNSSFLSQFNSPEEILRILWKRKYWLIAALVLGGVVSFGFIGLSPPAYRAGTMILVESQRIPTDYIRPTVTTSLRERLRTLEQQIKNRVNLERVVLEMDLYPELRDTRGIGYAVKLVRKNLRLAVTGSRVFEIHFSGGDPEKVAATTNRVAELFINENLRRRASEAENTSAFLSEELEGTKRLLEEQEDKLSEYRIRHAGELPEDRSANMQAIDQLETQLAIAQEEIRDTEFQIVMLNQETHFVSRMVEPETEATAPSQLDEAREELQKARAQYTDIHPDVIRLRREVELLQSQQDIEEGRQIFSAGVEAPEEDSAQDERIASLERKLVRLGTERDRTLKELAVYRHRLDAIPSIQKELVQVSRDYENLQESYQSLLSKRIEARLSENLERKRQSEQFTVLEYAIVPSKPYAPNKPRVLLLGLGVSAAFGLGLILLRERTDQTFRESAALRGAFPNVRFLGTIHKIDQAEVEDKGLQDAEQSA